MDQLLSKIESPRDLAGLSPDQLEQLADEMRDVLCELVINRTAHFASNLGVVELCLALHTTFDFSRDRLIWDTGHQIYPHKLITGRYHEFGTIRTKGGLMGYPNPAESEYDLFMTGHAGCSVSTALGLKSGDDLIPGQEDRHSVAVIGDGAFPSGIVFEAMNNAGGLRKKLLVVLNDNQMSICPRVGGLAEYLDRLRIEPVLHRLEKRSAQGPQQGAGVRRSGRATCWPRSKRRSRPDCTAACCSRNWASATSARSTATAFRSSANICTWSRTWTGPCCLARGDRKRARLSSRPPPTPCTSTRRRLSLAMTKRSCWLSRRARRGPTPTWPARPSNEQMQQNPQVTVMTAAMCQGNKLEPLRAAFPDRFFDTGICESHTVAFAAGQAKAGLRPIVDIYSTFLQRSFDQIFQEVALQNLPVTFLLDRAGLVGPDGPTHHGVFDLGYMRLFPQHGCHGSRRRMGSGGDARFRAGARRARVDPLSESHGRKPRRPAGTYPSGPRRSGRLGRRRHDHGLRHAAGQLHQGRRPAARRRPGRRRDQRPLRQAARYRRHPAGRREQRLRADGRRGGTDGRLRQRRAARPPPTPASRPRTSTAWAFPIGSSNMPSAASNWPIWGSIRRALPMPAAGWRPASSDLAPAAIAA